MNDQDLDGAIAAMRKTISNGFGEESLRDYLNALGKAKLLAKGDEDAEYLKNIVAGQMAVVRQDLNANGVDRDEREAAMRFVHEIEREAGVVPEPTAADHSYARGRSPTGFSRPATYTKQPA